MKLNIFIELGTNANEIIYMLPIYLGADVLYNKLAIEFVAIKALLLF